MSQPSLSQPSLPIDDVLPDLCVALARHRSVVLVAPPGAGKTTRVPLMLINESWVANKRIIILEPRRIAARAAAERMAQTLGEQVGETIGLRVRLGSKISQKTRIEVVTEGIFARMILDDPELSGIAAVLFDEFHERSLDADFGLALALDTQGALREDLRLLVMSATLDAARVTNLLQGAQLIESKGRAFPVETRYLGRDPRKRIEDLVSEAVMRALAEESGSLLVFLPGQGEIRRVEELLKNRIQNSKTEIHPLYGALSPAEQDHAVSPALPGIRKIVLTTSIAETSLTIEGVRVVIDSGLMRIPEFEPSIGLTRLKTVRVSRASADQRCGRAGRTEPGVCYRLWEEAATSALELFSPPEILVVDLSSFVLDCAAWGVKNPDDLSFLDRPPKHAISEARTLLCALEALDREGTITDMGKRLRALPLPVRLARMVMEAASQGLAQDAADLAAVLVERGLGGDTTDLSQRVEQFRKDRSKRATDMRRLASSWAHQAQEGVQDSVQEGILVKQKREASCLGLLLAKAYPDRIAKQRGKLGEFLMHNGRAGFLEPHDPLAREPFLVIADIGGRAAAARISAACALPESCLEEALGSSLLETIETSFDSTTKALKTRALRRSGALILKERPLPVPVNEETSAILAQGIAKSGLDMLPWSKGLLQWRERVQFLRRFEGESWPDVHDEALLMSLDKWLMPCLMGKTTLAAIQTQDLSNVLYTLLDWEQKRRLEKEAPTHFEAPTGSIVPIDYSGDEPVVSIRVQELFGIALHPVLTKSKVPLVFHLLSPAHRPIQITKDLPGFWHGSWAAVKADMKGQYPRHPWPDDPLSAPPTRRAKPRAR